MLGNRTFTRVGLEGVKFAVFSFESCGFLLHVGPEPQLLGVGLCFLMLVGWFGTIVSAMVRILGVFYSMCNVSNHRFC